MGELFRIRWILNLEFTNFVLIQLGAVIALQFKGLQLYGLNTGYWNASAQFKGLNQRIRRIINLTLFEFRWSIILCYTYKLRRKEIGINTKILCTFYTLGTASPTLNNQISRRIGGVYWERFTINQGLISNFGGFQLLRLKKQ